MATLVHVRGLRIHLDVRGPEDGEPVVLLHAIPGSSHMWRKVAPALADAGYRVITFDFPCTGGSEMARKADVGVDDNARLLRSLLDALGIEKAHVVGVGVGGCVAQVFAVRFARRVRSLVFSGSGANMNWPRPGMVNLQETADRDELTPDLLEAELTRMLERGSGRGLSDEALDAYLEPYRTDEGVAAFANLLENLDPRDTADVEEDLRDVDAPVLLLWGEKDRIHPPARVQWFREHLPHAEVRILPDAGHLVPEDAPDETVDALLSFFATAKREVAHPPGHGTRGGR